MELFNRAKIGLKDKDGVEIKEGDYLEKRLMKDGRRDVRKVIYNQDCAAFKWKNSLNDWFFDKNFMSQVKIIGNEDDNPELQELVDNV